MSSYSRLLVLSSLYIAQGLPFGFFTQAVPVRLREEGVSLGAIGLTSLLAAPWALKALWAPLVDRFGSRRSWIVPLQLCSVLALVVVSFFPPERAWIVVLGAVLLTNAFAAAQDVATDGFAVDVLAPAQRGLGNGIQVAGYRVGMIIGGGALLVVLGRIGWGHALRTLAILTALTTLPLLFVREPLREARPSVGMRALLDAMRRPGAGRWLVLLLVFKFGDAIASGMVRPLLVDRGYDAADVGVIMGQLGFGAGLVGALVGGCFVTRLGRGASLVLFGALSVVGISGYALAAAGIDVLAVAIVFEHLASGMATAALFTCMMDASRPEHAATDYTLQASLVVLASGLGSAISGLLADRIGYVGCFITAALLASCGVALANSMRRQRAFPLLETKEVLA